MMKIFKNFGYLFLLFAILTITGMNRSSAQVEVHPYKIEISKAELQSFDAVYSRFTLYVNTMNRQFKGLKSSEIYIIDPQTGKNYFSIAQEIKNAWLEESIRLRNEQGIFRSNPNMKAETPAIQVQAEAAKDTTGFTVELYSVAIPTEGCKELQIKGSLTYLSAGEQEEKMSAEIESLALMAESGEKLSLANGAILTVSKPYYISDIGEDEEIDYSIKIEGYQVIRSGVAGSLNEYNRIPLNMNDADQPQKIELLVKRYVEIVIPVDVKITLGL